MIALTVDNYHSLVKQGDIIAYSKNASDGDKATAVAQVREKVIEINGMDMEAVFTVYGWVSLLENGDASHG